MMRLIAPVMAIVCLGVAGFLVYAGSRTPVPPAAKPHAILSITPNDTQNQFRIRANLFSEASSIFRIGHIDRGQQIEIPFVIFNNSDAMVALGDVTSSCDCLEIVLALKQIEPNQSLDGKLILDFRKDPKFTGDLLLTADFSVVGEVSRKAVTLRLSASVK